MAGGERGIEEGRERWSRGCWAVFVAQSMNREDLLLWLKNMNDPTRLQLTDDEFDALCLLLEPEELIEVLEAQDAMLTPP